MSAANFKIPEERREVDEAVRRHLSYCKQHIRTIIARYLKEHVLTAGPKHHCEPPAPSLQANTLSGQNKTNKC